MPDDTASTRAKKSVGNCLSFALNLSKQTRPPLNGIRCRPSSFGAGSCIVVTKPSGLLPHCHTVLRANHVVRAQHPVFEFAVSAHPWCVPSS